MNTMTEEEYVRMENLTTLRMVLTILRECLGDGVVPEDDIKALKTAVYMLVKRYQKEELITE